MFLFEVLEFFLSQWYGHVFSQLKSESAIFMIKETSNKWRALLLQYTFLISLILMLSTYPSVIDLLKVNNKQSKVKNKNTRMTFLFIIVLVSLMLALTRFRIYSSFSIVDFELVNASWDCRSYSFFRQSRSSDYY